MADLSPLQHQANLFFRQRSTTPEAIKTFQAALDQNPDDLALREKIAALMCAAPNIDANLPLIARLHNLLPGNVPLAVQLCDAHFKNHRYSAAKKLAQHVLKSDPKHVFANHCLGFMVEAEGNFTEAAKYYRAIDRWLDVLRVYVSDGNLSGAMEAEARLRETDQFTPQCAQLLGWLYFKKGDTDKAITYWFQGGDSKVDSTSFVTALKAINELPDTHSDVSLDALPPEAQAAVRWLSEVASGDVLDSNIDLPEPYLEALAASRALVSLSQGNDPPDEKSQSLMIRQQYVVHYARNGKWLQAANLVKEDAIADQLRSAILCGGVLACVAAEDWTTAARLLTEQSVNIDLAALFDKVAAALWRAGQYEPLRDLLQMHPCPTTALFHRLALVCTRLAIQKDAEGKGFDDWNLAIGYWAVALSDANYWIEWEQGRSAIYGKDISAKQLMELREETVPDFIQRYHLEQAEGKTPDLQERHQYYAARLKPEIEFTAAMRHVIRVANVQRIEFPQEVERLISPLLIRMLGADNTPSLLTNLLSRLKKVSPHEAQLVRKAFSPLVEAYVWLESGEYANAVANLRRLHKQQPKDKDIERELIYALQQSAERDVQTGRWDEAISAAEELLRFSPGDADGERILAKAACGWAKQEIQQQAYQTIIDRLKSIRKLLKRKHADMDAELAEALVQLAHKIGFDEHPDKAVSLAEEALSFHPQNAGAANIAANVWHNRAMKQLKDKNYTVARGNAQKAMGYEPDPATAQLLANIHAAMQNWEDASDAAFQAYDLDTSQNNLHFVIHIRILYASSLYEKQLYAQAVNILQPLLELKYDPEVVAPHRALSAVLTDYGVWSINHNRRSDAIQQWRWALKLDPTNTAARNNLRVSGVYV